MCFGDLILKFSDDSSIGKIIKLNIDDVKGLGLYCADVGWCDIERAATGGGNHC